MMQWSWTRFLPFMLFVGFFLTACCGPDAESETTRWNNQTQAATEYGTKYASIKKYLDEDVTAAKAVWDEAAKASGEEQIKKMQDANNKLGEMVGALDKIKDKKGDLEKAVDELRTTKIKKGKEDKRDKAVEEGEGVLKKVDQKFVDFKPKSRDEVITFLSEQMGRLDEGINNAESTLKDVEQEKKKKKDKKKKKKKL